MEANVWDEMRDAHEVRAPYRQVFDFLKQLAPGELAKKEELTKKLFMSQGITFTLYTSGEGIEKVFPFDIIPRIITSDEWDIIKSGISHTMR